MLAFHAGDKKLLLRVFPSGRYHYKSLQILQRGRHKRRRCQAKHKMAFSSFFPFLQLEFPDMLVSPTVPKKPKYPTERQTNTR